MVLQAAQAPLRRENKPDGLVFVLAYLPGLEAGGVLPVIT